MELINVIEILPFQYSKTEYETPEGPSKDRPSEWYYYWKKCIKDGGLKNLEPIEKGSYLVDINSLSNNDIKIILQKTLEETDLENIEDEISNFYGGLVIKIDERILLEPKCCCDIGDLSGWNTILNSDKEEWQQLWIGHPWVFLKKSDTLILFSDYTEHNNNNNNNNNNIEEKFSVSKNWLELNIKRIINEQNDFSLKVSKILNELNIKQAEKIAMLLTSLK